MTSFLNSMILMNSLILTILVILIIIKRFIAVYDDYTITISDDESIKVHGGESLSNSLSNNDIFIPSACGGKGTCGFCKIEIEEGIPDPLSIEEAVLPYKEIISGYRSPNNTALQRFVNYFFWIS